LLGDGPYTKVEFFVEKTLMRVTAAGLIQVSLCLLSLGVAPLATAQDEESDSATGLPDPYAKNYLIAKGTISPDKKFAVIYPTQDSEDFPGGKNYFATLNPFAVLAALDTEEIYFKNESNAGLSAEWSKDDSAALVTWDGRWGPKDVVLLEVRDGKLSRATKLLAKMRELLRPKYRSAKPKPRPYNNTMEFIFTSVSTSFTAAKQVKIDALAATAPGDGEMSSRAWNGRIEATWDMAQAKFTWQKVSGGIRQHKGDD
jgi:hypothetical protein